MTDDQILDRILAAEGTTFTDDPRDGGGPTKYGITLNTLREWRRQPVTKDDVRQLTEAEARDIYRARYIAPFAAVDPEHKPQVVDIAVNSGITTARALYAVALANHGSRSVNNQLAIERLKHYARITKAKPTNVVFLNGWIARAVSFIALAVLCVGGLR